MGVHFFVRKNDRTCGEAGDFNDVTLAWNDDELQCSHWKVKVGCSSYSKQHGWWCFCMSSEKRRTTWARRRCQRQAANPEEAVWWRQHLLKSDMFVFKQKPGCLTFFVREIFRCLGLCSQTVETDALRLHWEYSSGCGLICGDSLGKQFQNLAVYWKSYCFLQ